MRLKRLIGLFAAALLIGCSAMNVLAEEREPAGYHVYEVQEDQASDRWYGIARGDHLRAAVSKLSKSSRAEYAICSGTTFAHRASDRVYVRIYLDQSDNGTDGWWTVNYWTDITTDNSTATARSGEYEITRDKYYSVKGSHSVTEGDVTESTTTCTDALYFD